MIAGPVSFGELEILGQYAALGIEECQEVAQLAAEQAREDLAEKLGFPAGEEVPWSTLTMHQFLSGN